MNECEKLEENEDRLQREKILSTQSKKREVQKKITSMMEQLPPRERINREMDEKKDRRKERQRIKKELWKYRDRKRKTETKTETNRDIRIKGENERMREKIEKIMKIKEIIRLEEKRDEERRQNRIKYIKRMKEKRKSSRRKYLN